MMGNQVTAWFDKLLYLGVAEDVESRVKVLQALTRKFNLLPGTSIENIATHCPTNLTGADFYALAADAYSIATHQLISDITLHGEEEVQKYQRGLKKAVVQVGESHFVEALKRLVPSVSHEDGPIITKMEESHKTEALRSLDDLYSGGFISENEYEIRKAEFLEGGQHIVEDPKKKSKLQFLNRLLEDDPLRTENTSMEIKLGMPNLDSLWKVSPNEIETGKMIAKGTFSTIYRGTLHGLQVIIKHSVPPKHLMSSLQREITLLKNLRHPNIVYFLGTVEDSIPGIKIVLEYMENGNLQQYLKNPRNQIPCEVSMQMAVDIACGMAYLHSRNFILRDLHGKYLLLDNYFNVKISHFRSVRAYKGSALKSESVQGPKATSFLAPEILLQLPYTEQSDLFSYGLVLLELITRKKIGVDIIRKKDHSLDTSQIQSSGYIPPSCPPAFYKLALLCCARFADKRPSFNVVVESLHQIQNSETNHTDFSGDLTDTQENMSLIQDKLGDVKTTTTYKSISYDVKGRRKKKR